MNFKNVFIFYAPYTKSLSTDNIMTNIFTYQRNLELNEICVKTDLQL